MFETEIIEFFKNVEYDITDRQQVILSQEKSDLQRWVNFYDNIRAPLCSAYELYRNNADAVLNQDRPKALCEYKSTYTPKEPTLVPTAWDCSTEDENGNPILQFGEQYWVCNSWPFSDDTELACILNKADYDSKKDSFLSGDLFDKEAQDEFFACTGVFLAAV